MVPHTSNASGDERARAAFARDRFVRFNTKELPASGGAAPGRLAGDRVQTENAPRERVVAPFDVKRGEDTVELPTAQERSALIAHLRGSIASGTYDLMSRLDVAAERLLAELDDLK